jgi:hypothetical protein
LGSASPKSITDGLLGYWKMDEGVGTTTADTSGSNLTASLENAPSWISGKYGVGISLNGSNQRLNIGNSPPVQLNTGTISAWIKTQDGEPPIVQLSPNKMLMVFFFLIIN